jgi:hypothetical protein
MASNPPVWSKRIAGWAALFFLVATLTPTLLILCVGSFGQRIEVHPDDVTPHPYGGGWFQSHWRIDLEYRYMLDGKIYSGRIDIRPDHFQSDYPPGTWLYYPPAADRYKLFEVAIWNVLPQFSIPLIAEYQPLYQTIPLWIMAVITALIYLRLRRI